MSILKFCSPPLLTKSVESDFIGKPIGFLNNKDNNDFTPREPRSKLELVGSIEYAITPFIICLVIAYVLVTKKDFNVVQSEITILVGIAAVVRTALITKRVKENVDEPR